MPTLRKPLQDVTPAGRLAEAKLHFVLGYQLAQATIVTNRLFVEHVGEPFGLRPVEYTVLTLIDENPGGSLARIARALAVTAPHITAIVDRLEQRKLIERSQSEDDRRTQVLHTTKKGSDLVRKATGNIVAAEKASLSNLSLGEHTILVELLHKVACARNAGA
jgi:DNA-binding MarR family transcriptional regulator